MAILTEHSSPKSPSNPTLWENFTSRVSEIYAQTERLLTPGKLSKPDLEFARSLTQDNAEKNLRTFDAADFVRMQKVFASIVTSQPAYDQFINPPSGTPNNFHIDLNLHWRERVEQIIKFPLSQLTPCEIIAALRNQEVLGGLHYELSRDSRVSNDWKKM